MSLRKKIFAAIYDPMSRASEEAGMREMRHGLLAEAGGSVLEIGAGTGANLAHYDDEVESLVFTEPEPAMLRRLQRKASEEASLAKILQAPAEDLPFEDDSFDCCSLSTCARTIRALPVFRTGSARLTASSSAATATARRSRRSRPPASRSRASSTPNFPRHRSSSGR